MELDTIACGDCLDVMRDMPDDSIDLIAVDPPYYKVKGDWWDRQWDTPAGFLDWIGQLCEAWHRILRPNGSLYVFASHDMSGRVEIKTREYFNVLNVITWAKPDFSTKAEMSRKDWLRSFFPSSERIIFAEHYGSDGYAKGEAGYTAKCDELRGFVFEPLRAYLDGERKRAGVPHRVVIKELGMTGHDTHFFSRVQWKLPLKEQYEAMREIFTTHNHGGSYLRREYEDLRREYEDLRREYEDLRRPFNASPERPYTDVWTFKTVSPYPSKHPCEKPLPLMEHIVTMSSNAGGGVVFDCCLGNGTTAVAALKLGRHFYGCDINPDYVRLANERIEKTRLEMSQMELSL